MVGKVFVTELEVRQSRSGFNFHAVSSQIHTGKTKFDSLSVT